LNAARLISAAGAVWRARWRGEATPLFVTFEATARCPLRCVYCRLPETIADELPTEEALRLIRALAKTGALRIGFTGGEPLLREDLGELIAAAKAERLFVSVFSNGLLVEERLARLRGVDALILSFDGAEEINDRLRGRGSFRGVERAAKAARRAGLTVWTNTVVSAANFDRLGDALRLADEWDARCMFQPLFTHERTPERAALGGLMPTAAQAAQAFAFLRREQRVNRRIWNSPPYLDYVARHYGVPHGRPCTAGVVHWTVAPDGRLACCGPLATSLREPPRYLPDGALAIVARPAPSACENCYCGPLMETDLLLQPNLRAWLTMARRR
jgi:pyrroloquinoline quinone biosynthesis protein E